MCIATLFADLPRNRSGSLLNITVGLPIFLFNTTERVMYGIFQADGRRHMDQVPGTRVFDVRFPNKVGKHGVPHSIQCAPRLHLLLSSACI